MNALTRPLLSIDVQIPTGTALNPPQQPWSEVTFAGVKS